LSRRIKSVAFIPARSGSKRVPDKNIKPLSGHPLLAYSVSAALESRVFDAVICATDDSSYADIAQYYGAEVPFLRSKDISGDLSADFLWVSWMLKELSRIGRNFDVFSILRPTSPFRLASTIRRASETFLRDSRADSLRAVQICEQHPGKMWIIRGERMLPMLPFSNKGTPWHSSQYTALPEIYVQDASLEFAWTKLVFEQNTIAGESIIPFISEGFEGFDINYPEDWSRAEDYIRKGQAKLPSIELPVYNTNI
jgi:CMP-N,N'-diacetyllegionaminic acid synthase